jgi:hypothetical protein
MERNTVNMELSQLSEKKQKLILGIKAAITLDRMDLVRKLEYKFQAVLEKEHSLNNIKHKRI